MTRRGVVPEEVKGLASLLREAGLPRAVAAWALSGRGFDNEVHAARLADGREVVLRRWRRRRQPEQPRATFLEANRLPAPRLLAATRDASLYELAPGVLLGDLIEAGRADDGTWRRVGLAYRRVHDIAFPAGLTGEVQPDRIVLRPVDPVGQMHGWIEGAAPGLRRRCPGALEHLPALHDVVDRAAAPLRAAATALLHGDINMWNVIVGDGHVWLIDWDDSRIGDPAREVALLDKHASLFNGDGLPGAFFDGYGRPPAEPNTSLHRVVQTVRWVASPDWSSWERGGLTPELLARTPRWLTVLAAYVAQLAAHVERCARSCDVSILASGSADHVAARSCGPGPQRRPARSRWAATSRSAL